MSEVTVKEEHEVKSEDGKLSIKLERKNGKFNYLYISGAGSGTIVRKKPKEIIKMLETLEEKVLS